MTLNEASWYDLAFIVVSSTFPFCMPNTNVGTQNGLYR